MSPIVYMPPVPPKKHDCDLPVEGLWMVDDIAPKYPAGTLWECDECGGIWELEHDYYRVRAQGNSRDSRYDRIGLVWNRLAEEDKWGFR